MSVNLSGKSTVLFTTDGLPEQEYNRELYLKRLEDTFFSNSHLPPDKLSALIQEDFRDYNGGNIQGDDDITFILIQTTL